MFNLLFVNEIPKELIFIFIIIGIVFILFIVVNIIIGFKYFNKVFRRKENVLDSKMHLAKEDDPDKKWLDEIAKEELTMKSYDKLNLKGYFVDNNGSNKLAIIVHGYHGSYRSLAAQGHMFYNNGFSLLLINNRCHGSSEGKFLTMGQRETRDLKDWIAFMNKRNPDFKIALFGVSLGGHIVMMAANRLPFNVMCAIEDCGFTSTYRQMLYTSNMTNAPLFRLSTFDCALIAQLFFKFSCYNNAKQTLSQARIPFMFMHGDLDGIVPFANLYRASSYFPKNIYKEEVIFRDCDHCEQIRLQRDLYEEKLKNFVNKFIK